MIVLGFRAFRVLACKTGQLHGLRIEDLAVPAVSLRLEAFKGLACWSRKDP